MKRRLILPAVLLVGLILFGSDRFGRCAACRCGRRGRARPGHPPGAADEPAGGSVDLFARVGETVKVRSPGDLSLLIGSVEEWRRLAPPAGGDAQWRDGRSAKESAQAWCGQGTPAVPAELTALLESREETRGFAAASAVPERLTFFADSSHGPRHHDLVIYGEAGGQRTVAAVEAKADESLDRPVGVRLEEAFRQREAGEKTAFPERVDGFARALLGLPAFDDDHNVDPRLAAVLYQLLSGLAGTIREAFLQDAAQAVFVVHVLDSGTLDPDRLQANEQGLEQFCELLRLDTSGLPASQLLGPVAYPGSPELPVLPLFIGLATRHH